MSEQFKISKNRPVPLPGQMKTKYPWRDMGINDSLFVSDEGETAPWHVVRAAHKWGKDNNVRFASRREHGGIRIWRMT